MHDTPEKGIFGDDYRFVSSGCVRVQNVRDYITWLLRDMPGCTRDKIDEAIASGQRIDGSSLQPVPVDWVYLTAWATPDGIVQFPRRHLPEGRHFRRADRDGRYGVKGFAGAP